MKQLVFVLPLFAVLVLATTASAQSISGTDHDLRTRLSINEICVPCHTPHNAYPDPASTVDMVLWNHDETGEIFTPYTTLAGNTSQFDGTSKLCLSCHDGVTAVDNYGGVTGGTDFITGSANMGTDLSNDHPIGVKYPPEDSGSNPLPGYNDPATFTNVKLVTVASVDRIECASCHDVHNNTNIPFLRRANTGSALCLECHAK